MLQLEYGFCRQNVLELDWYPNEKWQWSLITWMVDAVPQNARVLYRIKKYDGDKSLPLLGFRRDDVNKKFS